MGSPIDIPACSGEPSPSAAAPTESSPPPPAGPLRELLRPAGPPRFELSVEPQAEAVVVRVEGELDILTAPRLAARLAGVIRSSSSDLILDLRALEFMDSSGLQLLMSTRRRLLRTSRQLTVLCDEGPVRRVIEIARLTAALGVVDPESSRGAA